MMKNQLINTHLLMRPSPSDSILKTNDPLNMLREGNFLNRFPEYLHFTKKQNNKTDDLFNHYLSLGGNMNDIMTIRKEKLNPLRQGGIYEITKPMTQYIENETTNNPYPVRNAIVSQQVIPRNIVEQQEQPKSIVS